MSESIEIPTSLDGERIDRVVALLTGRSRSSVTELIGQGTVAIGGVVVTQARTRVHTGDVLEIAARIDEVAFAPAPADIDVPIVYVDDAIIVIDKPAGLVVHPGAGHFDDTLVSGLLALFPDLRDGGPNGDPLRPGIVHRLDKDTSGLLVVARTEVAYRSLVAQLKTRQMGRSYRALVSGHVSSPSGSIEAPIGRSVRRRTLQAVVNSGKPAVTHYEVMQRYTQPISASLVVAHLETGRTHQIRVHFAAIGHPIVGDHRYGSVPHDLSIGRPFLHAEKLTLDHPVSGETVSFESPLPGDLMAALDGCS